MNIHHNKKDINLFSPYSKTSQVFKKQNNDASNVIPFNISISRTNLNSVQIVLFFLHSIFSCIAILKCIIKVIWWCKFIVFLHQFGMYFCYGCWKGKNVVCLILQSTVLTNENLSHCTRSWYSLIRLDILSLVPVW